MASRGCAGWTGLVDSVPEYFNWDWKLRQNKTYLPTIPDRTIHHIGEKVKC